MAEERPVEELPDEDSHPREFLLYSQIDVDGDGVIDFQEFVHSYDSSKKAMTAMWEDYESSPQSSPEKEPEPEPEPAESEPVI